MSLRMEMRATAATLLTLLALASLGCGDDAGTGGTGGAGGVMPTGGAMATGGIGMTGGTGGIAGMAGMTGGTGATGAPTFSAIYQEVFVANSCNAGGLCHGGTVGQGGLTMNDQASAYAALVGVAAMGVTDPRLMLSNCVDTGMTRVVAGQPDMSLLMKKIDGTPPCGQGMPPGLPLPPAQVAQIRTWIMNGAMP